MTETAARFDVFVNVDGGGMTGQVGACMLGISRALAKAEPATRGNAREAMATDRAMDFNSILLKRDGHGGNLCRTKVR